MDYNFIGLGDFRILEESGLLLESGTYDGRESLHGNHGVCVYVCVFVCTNIDVYFIYIYVRVFLCLCVC